jgi:hypothetical protein
LKLLRPRQLLLQLRQLTLLLRLLLTLLPLLRLLLRLLRPLLKPLRLLLLLLLPRSNQLHGLKAGLRAGFFSPGDFASRRDEREIVIASADRNDFLRRRNVIPTKAKRHSREGGNPSSLQATGMCYRCSRKIGFPPARA